MKPESKSKNLLAITRSKAKMYEYNIPEQDHIAINYTLTNLLDLAISIVGDLSADFEEITNNGDESKYNLLFSAKYFDALLNSRERTIEGDYLKLLSASSYYLAGYPGSSLLYYGTWELLVG